MIGSVLRSVVVGSSVVGSNVERDLTCERGAFATLRVAWWALMFVVLLPDRRAEVMLELGVDAADVEQVGGSIVGAGANVGYVRLM